MGIIKNLDSIQVYKKAILPSKQVFDLCKSPSLQREYALCDQLKGASVSVCANIAEGYGRRSKAEFKRFLSISLGSCNETIVLLDIVSLNFPEIDIESIKREYGVLGRRIYTFRSKI